MLRTLGVTIVLALLSASLPAQIPQARLRFPVTASDSGAATRSFQLHLCLHPQATACLDTNVFTGFLLCGTADTTHVVEIEAPPDPPSAVFRFSPYNAAVCNINFWKDDVRKFSDTTQSDTFKLLLKTEPDLVDTHAVSYTWPACLGDVADSVILQQRLGVSAPGAYRINMALQSSFTLHVSTGGINSQVTVNAYVIIKGPHANQIVGVADPPPPLPSAAGLSQNFPNPFNPSTRIAYRLARAGHVTLTVYNLLGQPVATLVDANEGPGERAVAWDASDAPAGIYFYRLETADGTRVKRMVLMK